MKDTVFLPETNLKYYICVNRKEILDLLCEMGFNNAFLYSQNPIPEEDICSIREGKYGIYMIWYASEAETKKVFEKIYNKGIWTGFVKEWEYDCFLEIDIETVSIEKYLETLRIHRNEVDDRIDHWLSVRSDEYDGRCGNCHKKLRMGSKYCLWCGTKIGEGKFLPYSNEIGGLYGSPFVEKFKCPGCGYSWGYAAFAGGSSMKYCEKCGREGVSQSFEFREVDDLYEQVKNGKNKENIIFASF